MGRRSVCRSSRSLSPITGATIIAAAPGTTSSRAGRTMRRLRRRDRGPGIRRRAGGRRRAVREAGHRADRRLDMREAGHRVDRRRAMREAGRRADRHRAMRAVARPAARQAVEAVVHRVAGPSTAEAAIVLPAVRTVAAKVADRGPRAAATNRPVPKAGSSERADGVGAPVRSSTRGQAMACMVALLHARGTHPLGRFERFRFSARAGREAPSSAAPEAIGIARRSFGGLDRSLLRYLAPGPRKPRCAAYTNLPMLGRGAHI